MAAASPPVLPPRLFFVSTCTTVQVGRWPEVDIRTAALDRSIRHMPVSITCEAL